MGLHVCHILRTLNVLTTEVSTVDVVNKQATLITKTSLQPFVVTDLYVKSEN